MKFLCDFSLIKPDLWGRLKPYGSTSLLGSVFRREIHIFEPSKIIFNETNERILLKFGKNSLKSGRPAYTRYEFQLMHVIQYYPCKCASKLEFMIYINQSDE